MTKKTGGAASAASVGGVAATSTASTASNPSLENQTPAPSVDSTASAGAADQPQAPPEQSGDSAVNAESKATDSATGASLENQTPAPPVDSTSLVAGRLLDFWESNRTADSPSLENQTPPTSVDSKASTGVADQPQAPLDQAPKDSLKPLVWADEASGTAPAAPTAPVLDLWVLNSGAKAITESRTRTLLAVGRTSQIKINSLQVRATVIRNLEQLNHLAGAEYLKVVDQPPILDRVE